MSPNRNNLCFSTPFQQKCNNPFPPKHMFQQQRAYGAIQCGDGIVYATHLVCSMLLLVVVVSPIPTFNVGIEMCVFECTGGGGDTRKLMQGDGGQNVLVNCMTM